MGTDDASESTTRGASLGPPRRPNVGAAEKKKARRKKGRKAAGAFYAPGYTQSQAGAYGQGFGSGPPPYVPTAPNAPPVAFPPAPVPSGPPAWKTDGGGQPLK